MQTRRYLVTGRVQGVFFRAGTRDVALSLRMTGHAINLPDGSVEVVASGTEAAHRDLERWLRNGPRMARVRQVSVESLDDAASEGFAVG